MSIQIQPHAVESVLIQPACAAPVAACPGVVGGRALHAGAEAMR